MPNGTPGLMVDGKRSGTTQVTPLRDRLNINAADADGIVNGGDFHSGTKANGGKLGLRQSLASLPAPRNNYEIFVPEESDANGKSVDLDDSAIAEEETGGTSTRIADQSDLDRLREKEREVEAEAAWARRSQVVRRGLPRPSDINHSILRSIPPSQTPQQESAMTDLQRVCYLIMVCWLILFTTFMI